MNPSRILIAVLSFILAASTVSAAELPKTIPSAVCKTPPTIDGQIGEGEWKDAKTIEFDMPVLALKTQKLSQRACQMRVMNSANGLYLALSVPDETVNKSLNPIDFDFAMLAFCAGKELAAGDDRKGVAPGIYIDKHVTTPGKDADDAHQDGKGAMQHDAKTKVCAIEWALPLGVKDKEDVQAKPGDALRFSLAYFDAFQADLKETQVGAAYTGGLDSAAQWGSLQLATDVKDDGGSAFSGPAWVRKLIESLPGGRLKLVESTPIPLPGKPGAKVLVEYTYRNPRGVDTVGQAKLYLPAGAETGSPKLPLYYSAGYELDDASATVQVSRGFVVATPRAPEVNPLVRTANPDISLLHIARSLPFVDDARVIIGGGSAGGYITLMLAAETFPLSGAAPGVPPINWGYNAAYFLQRENGESRKDSKAPKTPVFDVIVPIVQQGTKVYGNDTSDETYFRHSPLAHVPTITCPVCVYWTTADMLVPIDQVGPDWVRPFKTETFPAAFTFAPDTLTTSKQGRLRLVDVLSPEQYEVFVLSEEQIKQHVAAKTPAELAMSDTKDWSITILDEGPPEPQVGHQKYPAAFSTFRFIDRSLTRPIAVSQLTEAKLQRLLDRYAGKEWLPTELKHLDAPAHERADVLRGLKTYTSTSPAHAHNFTDLYNKLPPNQRVLPAEAVEPSNEPCGTP